MQVEEVGGGKEREVEPVAPKRPRRNVSGKRDAAQARISAELTC